MVPRWRSPTCPRTASDIWVLPLSGDRQPVPILTTRFNESQAEFSPNGRWLAYTSNESGQPEVYVRPYPGEGGGRADLHRRGTLTRLVSGRNGAVLHDAPSPGGVIKMMAVPVTTAPTFTAGTPRILFEGRYHSNISHSSIRCLSGREPVPDDSAVDRPPVKPTQMILVQNWFEELKRRVPTN